MIKIDGIVKRFGKKTVLDGVSLEIKNGSIYGLVGINGAGKSTLLRIITGIYKPEEGRVLYDGEEIFDNPEVKKKIAFVPDELYLPDGSTMERLAKRYRILYGDKFSYERFYELASILELDTKKTFSSFSKGMRRQASTVLALALSPEYIFFDETFDGLDPFKRAYFKKVIAEDVKARGAVAIVSSHSLKELEGFCDRLAVLDDGNLVFESGVRELESGGVKVQMAFAEDYTEERFAGLDIVEFNKTGSVCTVIFRGAPEEIMKTLSDMSPILLETLPLSLEEIFNFETGGEGINSVRSNMLPKGNSAKEERK